MLYENFNTTNQTIPQSAAHDLFVVFVRFDGCSTVVDLPSEETCDFVKKEPTCSKRFHLVNYVFVHYCGIEKVGSRVLNYLFVFIMAFGVFYLIQVCGLCIGRFFCPTLNYLAKSCRMSQSLAGETLLAIGNGAASFFSSFANMKADVLGLYTGAYGGCIFQLSIVAGFILIVAPFHIYAPIYTRDIIFLLTITSIINYMMNDGTVNVYESGSLIGLYVLFLITVALDHIIVKRISRDVRRKVQLVEQGVNDAKLKRELDNLQNEGIMDILLQDSQSVLDIRTTRVSDPVGKSANENLFPQFLTSITPIDVAEWKRSNCINRFLQTIRTPFSLLFLLLVPRVDYNRPNHGWSKLLNVLQLLWTPIFLICASGYIAIHHKVFGISIFVYVFVVTIPAAILVFSTSRTDRAPVYHCIYSLFTLAACMTIIQQCTKEMSALTYTIGLAARLSPSFLQVTLSAWEGGVGALIANLTLALRGYPRMGFHGCFGTTLFRIPLTFGIRFMYNAIISKDGVAKVRQGPLGATLYTFLFIIATASYLSISLARHCARRSLGVYVAITYLIFLGFVVLVEFEIIHGHSTDHSDQRVKMD